MRFQQLLMYRDVESRGVDDFSSGNRSPHKTPPRSALVVYDLMRRTVHDAGGWSSTNRVDNGWQGAWVVDVAAAAAAVDLLSSSAYVCVAAYVFL